MAKPHTHTLKTIFEASLFQIKLPKVFLAPNQTKWELSDWLVQNFKLSNRLEQISNQLDNGEWSV